MKVIDLYFSSNGFIQCIIYNTSLMVYSLSQYFLYWNCEQERNHVSTRKNQLFNYVYLSVHPINTCQYLSGALIENTRP